MNIILSFRDLSKGSSHIPEVKTVHLSFVYVKLGGIQCQIHVGLFYHISIEKSVLTHGALV